jgi:hypothetical protein
LSTGLFDQERHRADFKQNPQFSFRKILEVGIEKDPLPFQKNLIDVGNKTTTVTQLDTTILKLGDKRLDPGSVKITLSTR